MGVDISHRNLVWLSTADDVCSRRKESGENLPGSWGDGKEGRGVSWKLGEIGDWVFVWMSWTDIADFECAFTCRRCRTRE